MLDVNVAGEITETVMKHNEANVPMQIDDYTKPEEQEQKKCRSKTFGMGEIRIGNKTTHKKRLVRVLSQSWQQAKAYLVSKKSGHEQACGRTHHVFGRKYDKSWHAVKCNCTHHKQWASYSTKHRGHLLFSKS